MSKGVELLPIKVLIADDDILIREGLKTILELDDNYNIVGCVENGLEAVTYCKKNEVDVALLDVQMPVMNGIDALKEISSSTKTKTLILTTFDDDDFIAKGIKNGVKGYILKNNSPDKIKEAINVVYSGNSVMQDVVLEKLKQGIVKEKEPKIDKEDFTEREFGIIELISKGMSNKEIAQALFISEGTVKNYISSILSKLNLEHRTQIAVYYFTGVKN